MCMGVLPACLWSFEKWSCSLLPSPQYLFTGLQRFPFHTFLPCLQECPQIFHFSFCALISSSRSIFLGGWGVYVCVCFDFCGVMNPQGFPDFVNISIDWEKQREPLRSRFSEILYQYLTMVGLDSKTLQTAKARLPHCFSLRRKMQPREQSVLERCESHHRWQAL